MAHRLLHVHLLAVALLPALGCSGPTGQSESRRSHQPPPPKKAPSVKGDDVTELRNLAKLRGRKYVEARDKLLASHPGRFDAEAIARKSWEAGLLAFLLEYRRAHPELYRKWNEYDLTKPRPTRALMPRYHPAVGDPKGLPFCVEMYYCYVGKRLRVDASREPSWDELRQNVLLSTLSRLPYTSSKGPADLWMVVWQQAPAERRFLRQAAIRAVASDKSKEAQTLARKAFASNKTGFMTMLAILRGVRGNPETALEFLKDTREVWVKKAGPTNRAVDILASLPDEAARTFLHELMLDRSKPLRLRKAVATECVAQPKPSDLEVCRKLIATGEEDGLVVAVDCLIAWRQNRSVGDVRSLLKELAGKLKNPDALLAIADYLIIRGTDKDVSFAKELAADKRLKERHRAKIRKWLEMRKRREKDERRM